MIVQFIDSTWVTHSELHGAYELYDVMQEFPDSVMCPDHSVCGTWSCVVGVAAGLLFFHRLPGML